MPLILEDTETADRDLTSAVTVLTHTPSAVEHLMCIAYISLGDGSKNLDGSGGSFEVTIQIGSQTVQPSPQTITFSTAVRSQVWTTVFPVPETVQVLIKVKSPNGADTDVGVIARLYTVPVGNVRTWAGFEVFAADIPTAAEIWAAASRTLTSAANVAAITTAGITVTYEVDPDPYGQTSGKLKLDQLTSGNITFTVYEDAAVRDVSGGKWTFAGYTDNGTNLFTIRNEDFDVSNAATGIVIAAFDTTDTATATTRGYCELRWDSTADERPTKFTDLEIVETQLSGDSTSAAPTTAAP